MQVMASLVTSYGLEICEMNVGHFRDPAQHHPWVKQYSYYYDQSPTPQQVLSSFFHESRIHPYNHN